jgi:hypothetical protein
MHKKMTKKEMGLRWLKHVQIRIATIEAMSIIRHCIQSHQEILLIRLVDCATVKSFNNDNCNAGFVNQLKVVFGENPD